MLLHHLCVLAGTTLSSCASIVCSEATTVEHGSTAHALVCGSVAVSSTSLPSSASSAPKSIASSTASSPSRFVSRTPYSASSSSSLKATAPGSKIPSSASSSNFPSSTSSPHSSGASGSSAFSRDISSSQTIAAISSPLVNITIGPSLIASGNATAVVIGTEILTPGGPALTTGTWIISLAPSGILKVDGSTTSLRGASSYFTTDTVSSSGTIVTSTMTTVPSGVSTQLIRPPGSSANTWITTTKDGHHTIVPAIWCSNCGPDFSGGLVIIWGFPKIPWVQFDWGFEFAGLPDFHLPCIKVFGIHISGHCPNPVTDHGRGSHSTSTASVSQSTSCTSSTIAEDFYVTCSTSILSISDTTSSTISCETSVKTVTGCMPTDSTTTTTLSSASVVVDFVIPTALYDDYNTAGNGNPFIMSLASSGMSLEDAIDATSVLPTSSAAGSATSSSTSHPSITGAGPYCIPYQDPDVGIQGYCQCSGGADFSFAKGSNPCPYTSPGPASLLINPQTVSASLPPPPTQSSSKKSAKVTTTVRPGPPETIVPILGSDCTPGEPGWGCSQNKTVILQCFCGNPVMCKWSSYTVCENESPSCHFNGDGGICPDYFSICC